MRRRDHEPLYPQDGEQYRMAMAEAQMEFDAWELTRTKLGGGIQIFTTKEVAQELGEDIEE
jgi:hypothetical protein